MWIVGWAALAWGASTKDGSPRVEEPLQASQPIYLSAIHGRVLEQGSGRPVAGEIIVGEQHYPLDADGQFQISVPAGNYSLIFEGADHLGASFSETLGDRDFLQVVYHVERQTWDETLTVYGKTQREVVSRRTFSAEELKRVPGAFGDPIRALQALPGVARSAGVEGDVVVRGAEALNTAVYIDEVPVPYLFHFFLGRSVVNPTLVDDVEFYAGGLPTRFGESTQAIVNVRTLDTKPDRGIHGKISADLFDFGVSGEGRIGEHFSWQMGYRVSWIGQLVGLGVRIYSISQGNIGYPALNYTDYLGRVAWENGPDRVVFTGFGAHDILAWKPPKDEEADYEDLPYDPLELMRSGFHRLHLRWDRQQGKRKQITWIAAGPDYEKSLFAGIGQLADGIEFGQLSGWNVVGRREDHWPVGKWGMVRSGFDFNIQPVKVEDYRTAMWNGEVPTTRDVRTGLGTWADWSMNFGKLLVTPGFRTSVFGFNHRWYVEPEPRISLRNELTPIVSWTGYVGRLSQMPPADRYAEGLGNPKIGLIRAWQVSTGVEFELPFGLEADLTIYGTHMPGMIVKDERVRIAPNEDSNFEGFGPSYAEAQIVPDYRVVNGMAWGIETMLRMRPRNGFFGWLTVNIGRSKRGDEQGVFPSDYDAPFSATLVSAYNLPKEWRISGRGRVTSGYPFTPLEPVYDPISDRWNPVPGEINSDRFPVFAQFDLRIDKTWVRKSARWTMVVDIQNIFNTQNPLLATYDPTYRERLTQIALPIIPNIGLEVEY